MPALWVAAACTPASLSDLSRLLQVIGQFLSLSLFSLGGGNTLLAEYHQLAVDQYCWLSARQFADLYALAEAAPGPSSMIVGLLGLGAAWREGPGWALLSACAAELAILLPSTLVMVLACLSWKRLAQSPLRVALSGPWVPSPSASCSLWASRSCAVLTRMARECWCPAWCAC